MAEKRMISSKITDHDNFTTLPATAQALYLHMVMSADDDGFCAQTNSSMLKAHAKQKDLEELVKRKYLIRFPSGVCAIKHWKMQNTIRADRYHETEYKEEKAQLFTKPNGAYSATKPQPSDNQPATKPQPSGAETRQNAASGLGLGLGIGLDLNTAAINPTFIEPQQPSKPKVVDQELARVMTFFLDRINANPSPVALESLTAYTQDLGADVVLHALGIALDERKTGWRYIQGILQQYSRAGLRTMDDVLRAEQDFEANKSQPKQTAKGPLVHTEPGAEEKAMIRRLAAE